MFDSTFFLLYYLVLQQQYQNALLLAACLSDSDSEEFDDTEESESSYESEDSGLDSCKLRQLQKELEAPTTRHDLKSANGGQQIVQIQAGAAKGKAVPRVLAWVNDQQRRKAKQPHSKQPEKNQIAGVLPQTSGPQAGQFKLGDVEAPKVPVSSTALVKQPIASTSVEKPQQRAPPSKKKTREMPEDWEPRRSKRTRIATDSGRAGQADVRSKKETVALAL